MLSGDADIFDAVASGLGEIGHWIASYHDLALDPDIDEEKRMDEMERLQNLLESHDGWSLQQKVEQILTKMNLPGDQKVAGLSGGWLRRVSLARALVC